jgi:cell division protein FtsB
MAVAHHKRLRFRWKKFVTVFVLAYLLFWSVRSGVHMWVLWHDQQALRQQITVVQTNNRQLHADIREMKNPALIKGMITGRVSIPNPEIGTR